jgi:hypothetical protein
MGLCWSEPPVQPVTTQQRYVVESPLKPSAPPYYQPPVYPPPGYNPGYNPQVYPNYQNPQYTYAVMPQQQQQMYQQQIYQQQQQNRVSPGTAFVGGLVMGAVLEDILDPE